METQTENKDGSKPFGGFNPLSVFCFVAFILLLCRIGFGVLTFPETWIAPLNVASTFLFVGLPIIALFFGAGNKWNIVLSLSSIVFGAALQFGTGFLSKGLAGSGINAVMLQALGQTGLLIWCLGLGASVALLIREKNLIVPIAIFLAGLDMFLVLTPFAPTAAIVEKQPEIFHAVASQVPQARVAEPAGAPQGAKVKDLAFIGPADFLFMAVFFCVLFRFRMRVKQTVTWLVPVMIGYLIIVLVGFGMLPALVPIGATVLFVNWREFKLLPDEKQATIGIAVVAIALAGFGLYQRLTEKPKQHAAPSQTAPGPGPKGPAGLPSKAGQG